MHDSESAYGLLRGRDRWSCEARRALLLAAELNERVPIDTLIFCDVHDLLAFNAALQARLAKSGLSERSGGKWRYPDFLRTLTP